MVEWKFYKYNDDDDDDDEVFKHKIIIFKFDSTNEKLELEKH